MMINEVQIDNGLNAKLTSEVKLCLSWPNKSNLDQKKLIASLQMKTNKYQSNYT